MKLSSLQSPESEQVFVASRATRGSGTDKKPLFTGVVNGAWMHDLRAPRTTPRGAGQNQGSKKKGKCSRLDAETPPKFESDLPNHLEGILVTVSRKRIFYLTVCSTLKRIACGPPFAPLPSRTNVSGKTLFGKICYALVQREKPSTPGHVLPLNSLSKGVLGRGRQLASTPW